ncbi:MAG: glycosyltransferase family 2 protein [Alphaproteobacteria bacterium]|nr:glycosyltransferase family 2 protein [Alphaproteobacteria bacterium]
MISIIIPCYNEEEVIEQCHSAVTEVIDALPYDFEIIYINDGSRDNTRSMLDALHKKDKRAKIFHLSRNFGKEAAMTAGLDHAKGDAVIILDADLQDPPHLIPEMLRLWKEEKADVVYGQRLRRQGETWLKRKTARAFYKIINFISAIDIPVNTGDFRLMNRRALDALLKLRENHRFMKGLFAWIGFRQIALHYNREPRAAGTTKWNYIKLWNLALEGITGFSITPLRIASMFGFLISLFAFAFGIFIILHTLISSHDLPGYPSLMVMVTFLSGIQLLTIGILGEYIGRIFGETKKRPLYFIDETLE